MHKTIRHALLAAATIMVATSAVPAQAVTFNLVDIGGTGSGSQARRGFEAATYYWSSVLKDNVTINLQIGFVPLGNSVIGQTGAAGAVILNSSAYSALSRDATSALDRSAVGSLQPLTVSSQFPTAGNSALSVTANQRNRARTSYLDTSTRVDDDGSANNVALAVLTANAKALGLSEDVAGNTINYSGIDGAISFNSDFNFDFDPRDGITAGTFDFIGVAIHEIGHALGFISGVDSYDIYTGPGAKNTVGALENFAIATPLDLFRYSAPGRLDWSTQNTPYLSADGGQTQLFGNSLMSTGTRNGDGRQASHWKDSNRGQPQLGVLDPTAAPGQMLDVTALDLAGYDIMGWDIAFDALTRPDYRDSTGNIYARFLAQGAVPEPASWAMMIAGVGLAGGALRRRRAVNLQVTFA